LLVENLENKRCFDEIDKEFKNYVSSIKEAYANEIIRVIYLSEDNAHIEKIYKTVEMLYPSCKISLA
jgi:hypothetical protein